MRERMAQISQRIDAGVEECWVAAGHGDRLAKARSRLDTKDKAKELSRLRSAGAPEPGSSAARTAEALQAQLDSAARLDATIEATRDRLRLLDARMAEALARAVELSVDNARADELNGLNDTVEGVVAEMESLRLGLEET
jgi:small-conductance mechanosensitive channel